MSVGDKAINTIVKWDYLKKEDLISDKEITDGLKEFSDKQLFYSFNYPERIDEELFEMMVAEITRRRNEIPIFFDESCRMKMILNRLEELEDRTEGQSFLISNLEEQIDTLRKK